MKGRLIGALFIAVALIPTYYYLPGEYFQTLFFFCLAMSMAEIWVVAMHRPYQIQPTACKPHGVWPLEFAILFFAALFCATLKKEEIAFVVIACFLSDTGAFAFGKLIGRHKATLVSDISPNKTIEGCVGGILFAFLAVPVTRLIGIDVEISPALLVYLLICGPAAEIGDLLGSATKRQLTIKDSGDVLKTYPFFNVLEFPLTLKPPLKGMGGYLDRLDSISLGLLLFAIIVPRS